MRYRVNYSLLERLPSLYWEGAAMFHEISGIPYNTWYDWVNKKNFNLCRLITMCNKLYIPFEHIVAEDDSDIIPAYDDLFRNEDEYFHVTFLPESIKKFLNLNRLNSKLSKEMNVKRNTINNWLSPQKESITLEKFLTICNIIDQPYKKFVTVQQAVESNENDFLIKIKKRMEKMALRIRKLEMENRNLKEDKERLWKIIDQSSIGTGYMVAETIERDKDQKELKV